MREQKGGVRRGVDRSANVMLDALNPYVFHLRVHELEYASILRFIDYLTFHLGHINNIGSLNFVIDSLQLRVA